MGKIMVGNAPCSWGVLEFKLGGTVDAAHKVLSEMARAGYSGTELGDYGFMPTEPDALKALLEQYGLEMIGAFVPVPFRDASSHEKGVEYALKIAKLIGAVAKSPILVLSDDCGKDPGRTKFAGRIQKEQSLSQEEWKTFAKGVELVASEVYKQCGLRSAFHNHCAGFVETPWELQELMERTDPSLVGLCLDTGHYAFGGGDPCEALERYKERVWHVHFKDCDPLVAKKSRDEGYDYFRSVKEGVFCELGKGMVKFPQIVEMLTHIGYEGYIVVEQDVLPGMGTPFESAVRNRDYLRSLGL